MKKRKTNKKTKRPRKLINPKLGIAYGMGVDSTALLVGLVARGIRPDYILFADIGAEKEATYEYLPIIQAYLKKNGFPPVTVVKYTPKFAPYTTLEGNMVMNATLPGAAFNLPSCTVKFKIIPQELDYYRQQNLPIPHLHPDERHKQRLKLENQRKLHIRNCDKCTKEISTTFSADKAKKVYCEDCYLKEVY